MIKRLIILTVNIAILIVVPSFFSIRTHLVYAQLNQANGIGVELDVVGNGNCNNDGICEAGETPATCPVDCAPPRTSGGYTSIPTNIYIYDLLVEPDFESANISWKSSVSTLSAIKWGETTEVKEGTLHSVIFARDHKVQLIDLKPGTMYYFTIESTDVNGKTNINPPVYFFTKFEKNTAFPLSPRNVKASSDIPGITISWQNPPDPNFSYVRIMRYEDHFRGDPFLGKLIYEGTAEKFLDKDVIAGKKYFYTLFARDTDGSFSTGVGVSATAYSPSGIGTPIGTPINPPAVNISQTFFAHQYDQLVEPLTDLQAVTIDTNENTVVDINSKTLSDDWMEVRNENGEIVGQYLFSFNSDSGRYQSVIAPLQNPGIYAVKIYRYINDIPTLISEGSLNANKNVTPKIYDSGGNIFNDLYIYIIILLIMLFLFAFFLKRRRKTQ